jgi:sortase A
VAVLSIPAIGVHRTVVVAGTRSGDLESGPGVLPGSVLPGEVGVSVIMGRAFSYGGPFRRVGSLAAGDAINVTTGQGTYRYTVLDSRGPGQSIPRSATSAASRLTLITAANGGWQDLWVPTHAIFVDAALKGTPGGVAPGVVPVSADQPMQADSGSLVALVLWLQLLLISALLVVWAAVSWGRRHAWTLGVPVIVGGMWGVSLEFTKLLPNLL